MTNTLRNQHLKKNENLTLLWVALFQQLEQSLPQIKLKIEDGLSSSLDISSTTIYKYLKRNDLGNYKQYYAEEDVKLIKDLLLHIITKANAQFNYNKSRKTNA